MPDEGYLGSIYVFSKENLGFADKLSMVNNETATIRGRGLVV
jgi:hypothetical protein